jgi:predicted nucleic acid-binding protein
MILVDTSVLIDFLNGTDHEKTRLFDRVINSGIRFGISAYTYQEVLQGARNETEYSQLQDYLSTQKIYFLPENIHTYTSAAKIFFELRRRGITIRSSIDVLIALTAIQHNLFLLHNDKDFAMMATGLEKLRILEKIAF